MAMTHCSLSLGLGTAGVEGLRDGKLHASWIVFVIECPLVHVGCVLVYVLVSVHESVQMSILIWIHTHAAPPRIVGVWS